MLRTNRAHARKVIRILLEWYRDDQDGIFSRDSNPFLKTDPRHSWYEKHGIHADPLDYDESSDHNRRGMRNGSYEHIMYLTMISVIDYQRDRGQLWEAADATWNNSATRWVFYPKRVAKRPKEDLAKALARYGLNRKTKKDVDNWHVVACSFAELFGGDPRNLFKRYGHDADRIATAMREEHGRDFPFLAGRTGTGKIRSMWIRLLYDEAHVRFVNMHKITIPPDTHVVRSTVMVGCLTGSFEGRNNFPQLAEQVKQAWSDVCKGTDHYPLELDEPLLELSSRGCSNYRDRDVLCPVRSICRLANHCTANDPSSRIRMEQNGSTAIKTRLPRK